MLETSFRSFGVTIRNSLYTHIPVLLGRMVGGKGVIPEQTGQLSDRDKRKYVE